MIWFASIVFSLAAIVIAFFQPVWAWVILGIPIVWIFVTWIVLRSRKAVPVPEVSFAAKELLRKFGHYYAHPFAGAAYSSAASALTLASMAVAIIGAFKGFWWGIAIGLIAYWTAAFLARQFNPTAFLLDDRERSAHDELVAAILAHIAGSQQNVEQDKLVPLLRGIVRPLQQSAVEQINLALGHIPEGNPQGRFMMVLLQVCLASILDKLESEKSLQKGLSKAFEEYAISQWDRPKGMSVNSLHEMFAYTQQELGNKLVHPDEDALVEVGLMLLSIAQPNQEKFKTTAALACGQCAYVCWTQAALETDKVLKIPLA